MMHASRSTPMLALAILFGIAHPAGAADGSDQAMMDGMGRMNRAMRAVPMTGDPDRDFVAMMIPHHQGAISMAEVELRYGHDPALRRLADAIIAAQRKEIATMRRWHPQPPP